MTKEYSSVKTFSCGRWPGYKASIFLLWIFSSLTLSRAQQVQSLSAREIARLSLPSVVLLVTTDKSSNVVNYGSGFFVRPDVIVTNFHVIENSTEGYVKIVGEETKYEIIGAIAIDKKNDLALVKVKGANGKPLTLQKEPQIAIGDQVFAVGNPKGLEGTFSQGIVSSIRRENGDSVLQITAPLSPGSSGGPVLDSSGQVIGIAVGAIEGGQALNFAIPSVYLAKLLLRSTAPISLNIIGRTRRPAIGTRPIEPGPESNATRSLRSFKKPDHVIGLSEHRYVGSVSNIEVSHHKFTEKFGKWEITEPWDIEKVVFDLNGNIESEEGRHYKDFMDLASIVGGPVEPSRFKRVYTYDYDKQELQIDLFWAPLQERILEYRSKQIKKYAAGELIETASYKSDGSLQDKTVETRNLRARTSTWYRADGTKLSSEVIYIDSSGAEIYENQNEHGKVEFRTRKDISGDTIIRIRHNYIGGSWSRVVSLSDLQRDLEFESTAYLDEKVTEHTKTEYEFDSRGNWIRQTVFKEVSKFGRTYFEPQTVTIRRIMYRPRKSVRD